MSSVEWHREEARLGRRAISAPRIYLHFLDFYTYARSRRSGVPESAVLTESRRALRLSVLHAEQILVPASSYFESRIARRLFREHAALADLGLIQLVATDDSLAAHQEAKLGQYDAASPTEIWTGYRTNRLGGAPPYLRRDGSSVAAIRGDWMRVLERQALAAVLDPAGERHLAPDLEKHWARVPADLGGRAFVAAHVRDLLARHLDPFPEDRIAEIIENAYIRGYASALDAHLVGGFSRLRVRSALRGVGEAFSLQRVQLNLAALGLDALLDDASMPALLRLRVLPQWDELKLWLNAPRARIADQQEELAGSVERLLSTAHAPAATIDLRPRRSRHVTPEEPSIAIVTALPEEHVAVHHVLGNARTRVVTGDPAVYRIGAIPSRHAPGGAHHVVLTQLPRMGTNSAASSTAALARSFPTVRDVLMVGIACAVPHAEVPAEHVRLGDVVVSDRRGVIQFDHVTVTAGGSRLRDLMPPPSARMTGALNRLESRELQGDFPCDAHLDDLVAALPAFRRPSQTDVLRDAAGRRVPHPRDRRRRRGRPRVFRGLVGSADVLLRDAAHRDALRDAYGVRAIEMEASGVAESAWQHALQYLVVRGTCDYGDAGKSDRWHRYAAAAAACYARCVIEEMTA